VGTTLVCSSQQSFAKEHAAIDQYEHIVLDGLHVAGTAPQLVSYEGRVAVAGWRVDGGK
jgi:hypothetical protein